MKENPLLFRNLRALNLIGMWEPKNPKYGSIYNVFSKLIFIWFVCFTTSQFIEIGYIYDDFKEFTSNTGVSLLYAVGIAKVYIVLFKKKRIIALVNTIRDTEQTIVNSNNVHLNRILNDYVLQNWSVSKKFWLLTFWTIMGFFISPSIEATLIGKEEILFPNGTSTGRYKKPLVFSSWFPFDKYAENYYIVAYGLQTISGTFGASYLGIWDTFIVALMIFAIGQFRVLQYTLKNIYPTERYEDTDTIEKTGNDARSIDDIVTENFYECVIRHNMIIKYIKDLDNLISPVMFLDFGVCSLMLCAIGLQAILEGPTIRLAFTIEYLIAMLVQLFMFYWHANEIMLESMEVSKAAWESHWYECSDSVKKGLILVMMRSQRPCTLTAGRFYTMSLQTFIAILKTSYSYLALLRQVYGRSLISKYLYLNFLFFYV